ncbi:hypothetical protein OMCYN_01169 [cyanobiont of Ornithocercus magnificus]|nr:hypothetical protein OMCYN_01169 [cyanobiont of Ornithocercus magnificus]
MAAPVGGSSPRPQPRTSLKWQSDGELAGADLLRVLRLLAAADPEAGELNQCRITPDSGQCQSEDHNDQGT